MNPRRRSNPSGVAAALWMLAAVPIFAGADCGDGIGFRLPDPNVRVIAFGDSTTAGPSMMQYVEYLPDLLGEPENAFSNEGMGGETTTEGVARLQSLLNGGYLPNADTIIIWEGGNDIIDFIQAHDPFIAISPNDGLYPFGDELQQQLDATAANLASEIGAARAAGLNVLIATYFFIPEEIFTCNATPLDVIFPGQARVANDYTERLNESIRNLAAVEQATLIDIATLDDTLRGDLSNYENCNHLSAAGNAIAAQQIAESL
ncbi:MAG: SGNH/GDSL hydrolase family protein [Phycisphaerales bacterium]|nr:SGNH/GDSL hydrolase family protein [Phycisphaerales bacterium]MCB9857149.1 SGNH/GDSL hydrolase family protein [Phycisphaerales bacterium]MCB9861724.1 SGNH/GDSL hydrolase family protein [Phycisphaerales bacterium]